MKRHPFAMSLLSAGLMAAMTVPAPRIVVEDDVLLTDEPDREKPTNLPGETNRQFAARMKAERPA